jgi:hypothetical protein
MPVNDKFLIKEFDRIVKRNSGGNFVNLDEKFTEKFTFFVQTVEEVLGETGPVIPPNRWSYHRLLLVTDGCADYTCGIYKFRAQKNSLIIIPARVVTTSEWLPETKGFITLFNLDFFLQNHFSPKYLENKTILLPSIEPLLQLTNGQAAEAEASFKALLKEKESGDPHSHQLMA